LGHLSRAGGLTVPPPTHLRRQTDSERAYGKGLARRSLPIRLSRPGGPALRLPSAAPPRTCAANSR
jgi:hypothetical protein